MKILVGYKGKGASKTALELAKDHVTAFGGEVFIVTSMEGGPGVPKRDFEHAEQELAKAAKGLSDENIDTETALTVNGMTPGEDIVDFAKEKAIDEIIIGVKRRSKVGKLIFGSTAQYVILNASCPVVTVR